MPYTPSGGYYELSATGRAIKAGSKNHPGIERGHAMARIKTKRKVRKNPTTPQFSPVSSMMRRVKRDSTCYLVLSVRGRECLKGARLMQQEVQATGRLNIKIVPDVCDCEVVSALITDSINVR